MFEQISILAPGLLGASLGMAANKYALAKRIHVWARRAESRADCLASSWCDAAFADPGESVRGSNLVILCTPVDTITGMVEDLGDNLEPGTVVTDVGSTKSRICRVSSHAVPDGVTFIGSHPMAGSEKSGMAHADADLFKERACLVTPLEGTASGEIDKLVWFWRSLGMEVSTMTPEKHDEIVAHISHLPHLLASALSLQLSRQPDSWQAFSGQGLRDTTRVAAGSPEIWRSIFDENKDELLRSIDGFERELSLLRSHILNGEWAQVRHLLELGKTYREDLD